MSESQKESPKGFLEPHFESLTSSGLVHQDRFGLIAQHTWSEDPRKLGIMLSRYKFAAKMLEGCENVLEVGCGDAFATRVVQQTVRKVTVADIDPVFLEDVKKNTNPRWPIDVVHHDMTAGPIGGDFDGIFAMDVLEHIPKDKEDSFLRNLCGSMTRTGILILGMPSLESQIYASDANKVGHVNCKSGLEFRGFLKGFFDNVFTFSMNDEVVHTGYFPMAHYLISVCCSKRVQRN